MLIGETVVYFLLYLYLDEVVPNEYGSNKRALFFLDFITKRKRQNKTASLDSSLTGHVATQLLIEDD